MLKISNRILKITLGAALFAMCGATSFTANANLIDDVYGIGAGSFELGAFVNGGGDIPYGHGIGYMSLAVGNTTITGWTVGGPGDGVDWITTPMNADTGIYAVDLQHSTYSSISTVIPTVIGSVYELSFSAAAPVGSINTGVVSAGSLVSQAFAAPFSSGYTTQVFTPFSFLFTATGSSTPITFQSTASNAAAYGPAIDSVSVEWISGPTPTASVPEPSSLALLGIGVIGFGMKAARRQRSQRP